MARKSAAAKAAEVKEEVTAVVEATAEEATPKKTTSKRTAAKKTAEKKSAEKTAEKKPRAKRTTAKAETQTNLFIQYQGAELSYADLIERAKADAGVKSPATVNLYVKPEDNMVYYVVDEKDGGFTLA